MQRRNVLIASLCLVALIAGVTLVYAANIYLSPVRQSTVVEYLITLETVSPQLVRYANVVLTGRASLGPSPMPTETIVTLTLNGTSIGTALTDASGNYQFTYNVTQASSTVLNFQASISA